MKKKTRKRWKGSFRWSELKRSEGGAGLDCLYWFKNKGLKAVRDYSPYVGHVGIRVCINNRKEAIKAAQVLGYGDVNHLWLLAESC